MLTRVAAGAFALGCLIAPFQPAQAEEPVETAIREWVSSINASPDWRAGYRKLSYDAADGHAVLSGLTIQSEEPGVTIGFENVAIFGFRETSDGGFSAQRITADGGAGEFGAVKVALADVDLSGIGDGKSVRGAKVTFRPGIRPEVLALLSMGAASPLDLNLS